MQYIKKEGLNNTYFSCYDDNKNFFNNKNRKCSQKLLSEHSNIITDYFPNSNRFKDDIYIDKYNKIANTNYNKCPKNIKNHNIDTSFIFNKSLQTKVAYFINKENNLHNLYAIPKKSNVVYGGGDGSVQSDGSILPALKWIYENIKNKASNKIKLFDYCSPIKKELTYNNRNEINDKNYHFVNCQCKDEDSNFKVNSHKECNHSYMLSDPNIVDLVFDIIININNTDYNGLNKKQELYLVNKDIGH